MNISYNATNLLNIGLTDKEIGADGSSSDNFLFEKTVIEKSGQVNNDERAECAIDDDFSTKWCDFSGVRPKFISVDMGEEKTIKGWRVMHAGIESLDYITKEYSLQVKTNLNDEWKTVDTVSDNTADETERLISTPTKARYVRLLVTKPDQSEGQTTRIYEFSVY